MVHHIGDRMTVAGLSDVGLVRTLNEDNFYIDSDKGLLIVADGMGGHEAGEVASAKVIDAVRASLSVEDFEFPANVNLDDEATINLSVAPEDLEESGMGLGGDFSDERTLDDIPNPILGAVSEAVKHANAAVNNLNNQRGYPDGMGMGSTLVGLWLPEFSELGVVFHVGDSRLYLFRQGKLQQLTLDHTLYQQWASFGGAGIPPAKNILIQAMGPSRQVSPEVAFQDLVSGDLVLLCSDGLTGMVDDVEISAILAKTGLPQLEEGCRDLVAAARRHGGKDNITVVLGYVH